MQKVFGFSHNNHSGHYVSSTRTKVRQTICLPEIVRGPRQKVVLCHDCVYRARTSLDWHLHLQHFESVPRHERLVINNHKNTYATTGKS